MSKGSEQQNRKIFLTEYQDLQDAVKDHKRERKLSDLLQSKETSLEAKRKILEILFKINSGQPCTFIFGSSQSLIGTSQSLNLAGKKDENKYLQYLQQLLETQSLEAEIETESYLTKILYQEKDVDKAARISHQLKRYTVLAYYQLQHDTTETCIKTCQNALRETADKTRSGTLNYICGLAYEKQGDNSEALNFFRQAHNDEEIRGGLAYYKLYKFLALQEENGNKEEIDEQSFQILSAAASYIARKEGETNFSDDVKEAAAEIYENLSEYYGAKEDRQNSALYAARAQKYRAQNENGSKKKNEFTAGEMGMKEALQNVDNQVITKDFFIKALEQMAQGDEANSELKINVCEILYNIFSTNGAILSYYDETSGAKKSIFIKKENREKYEKFFALAINLGSESAREIITEEINKDEVSAEEFNSFEKKCRKYGLFDILGQYYLQYRSPEEALKFIDSTKYETLRNDVEKHLLFLKGKVLMELGKDEEGLENLKDLYDKGVISAGTDYARGILKSSDADKLEEAFIILKNIENHFRNHLVKDNAKPFTKTNIAEEHHQFIGDLFNLIGLYNQKGKGTEANEDEAKKNYLTAIMFGNKFAEFNLRKLVLYSDKSDLSQKTNSIKKFEEWKKLGDEFYDGNLFLKLSALYEIAKFYKDSDKEKTADCIKEILAGLEQIDPQAIIKDAEIFYLMAQACTESDSKRFDYLMQAAGCAGNGDLKEKIRGEINGLIAQENGFFSPPAQFSDRKSYDETQAAIKKMAESLESIGFAQEAAEISQRYSSIIFVEEEKIDSKKDTDREAEKQRKKAEKARRAAQEQEEQRQREKMLNEAYIKNIVKEIISDAADKSERRKEEERERKEKERAEQEARERQEKERRERERAEQEAKERKEKEKEKEKARKKEKKPTPPKKEAFVLVQEEKKSKETAFVFASKDFPALEKPSHTVPAQLPTVAQPSTAPLDSVLKELSAARQQVINNLALAIEIPILAQELDRHLKNGFFPDNKTRAEWLEIFSQNNNMPHAQYLYFLHQKNQPHDNYSAEWYEILKKLLNAAASGHLGAIYEMTHSLETDLRQIHLRGEPFFQYTNPHFVLEEYHKLSFANHKEANLRLAEIYCNGAEYMQIARDFPKGSFYLQQFLSANTENFSPNQEETLLRIIRKNPISVSNSFPALLTADLTPNAKIAALKILNKGFEDGQAEIEKQPQAYQDNPLNNISFNEYWATQGIAYCQHFCFLFYLEKNPDLATKYLDQLLDNSVCDNSSSKLKGIIAKAAIQTREPLSQISDADATKLAPHEKGPVLAS